MGVSHLWKIIKPAKRTVDLQSVSELRLAVDVSLWLLAFEVKQGSMDATAYLRGLFSRICKLLYFNVKPVFVFDGSTPDLKKHTVIARKEQQENAVIRKLAKKILKERLSKIKKAEKEEAKKKKEQEKEKKKQQQLEKQQNTKKEENTTTTSSQTTSTPSKRKRNEINYSEQKELNPESDLESSGDDDDSDEQDDLNDNDFETNQKVNEKSTSGKANQKSIEKTKDNSNDKTNDKTITSNKNNNDEENTTNTTMKSKEQSQLAGYFKPKSSSNKSNPSSQSNTNTNTNVSNSKVKPHEIQKDSQENFDDLFLDALENEEEEKGGIEPFQVPDQIDEDVLQSLPSEIQMEILSQMKNSLYNTHNVRIGFGKKTKTPVSFSQLQVERLLQTNKITRKMNELRHVNANDNSVLTDSDEDLVFIENQELTQQNRQKLMHTPSKTLQEKEKEKKEKEKNGMINSNVKLNSANSTPTNLDKKEPFYFLKNASQAIANSVTPVKSQNQQQQQTNDISPNKQSNFTTPLKTNTNNSTTSTPNSNNSSQGSSGKKSNNGKNLYQNNEDLRIENLMATQKKLTESLEISEKPITIKFNTKNLNEEDLFDLSIFDEGATNVDKDQEGEEEDLFELKRNNEKKKAVDLTNDDDEIEKNFQAKLDKKLNESTGEYDDVNDLDDEAPSLEHFSEDDLVLTEEFLEEQRMLEKQFQKEFKQKQNQKQPIEIFDEEKDSETQTNMNVQKNKNKKNNNNNDNNNVDEDLFVESVDVPTTNTNTSNPNGGDSLKSVETEVVSDCQELLRLFGIPYVMSPMEAESQCAFLKQQKLVDGIVTNDSDVFLFGGDKIYKNMFKQNKIVEVYETKDIEKATKFKREDFVRLAQLLGSDYCDGVLGVGPAIAVDIVKTFPDLETFVKWFKNPDDVKIDNLPKRLKGIRNKIELPAKFPEARVSKSYLQPVIDESTEKFQWKSPDLQGIRDFLARKLGWSAYQTDEKLVPVLQKYNPKFQKQGMMDTFVVPKTSSFVPKPAQNQTQTQKQQQQLVQSKQQNANEEEEEEIPLTKKQKKKH